MQLLILAAWASSGVALSAVLSTEPGRRLSWTPMAAILGPMWALIASEQ